MTNHPNRSPLAKLATKIRKSRDLWQLRSALIEFDEAARESGDENAESELPRFNLDLCGLPTFGGQEPRSTSGVWSWDTEYLLVGEGRCRDWAIVEREKLGN